jgi:acetyl-CoA carboxylase alpha subunit
MSKRHFLDFEQPIAELESKIDELRYVQNESAVDISDEIERLGQKSQQLTKDIYSKPDALAGDADRAPPAAPYTLDYVNEIFTDFQELHGDRHYADDLSIVGGLARFNGQPCMVLGHQKGRDTKERTARNFGMSRPEGYRKALRLMKLAEKFGLPVFTFVDTPGAYPGIGAEERGQSEAIGRNIFEMAQLRRCRSSCTIIGEGGSGGALAISVGDQVLMLQYSDLLGDLARGLRVHPVEDRRARVRRRRSPGHHRAPAEGPGRDRQDRQRTRRRRAPRPEVDGRAAQARAQRRAAPGRRPQAQGTAAAPLRAAAVLRALADTKDR